MKSHFLVQVNNLLGYPNVTRNQRYENDLWSKRRRDRSHGQVEPGDTLLFYCTQDVPTDGMSLALQAEVTEVSNDKTTFDLGEPDWFPNPLTRDRIQQLIDDDILDEAFRSCGAQGFNIRKLELHSAEKVLQLLSKDTPGTESISGASTGSPLDRAIERELEQWLVDHWSEVDFGANLVLYTEDGDAKAGHQYDTGEVGRIDLLCEDQDSLDLVVVELKRGRASDQVVGQLARYVGWVEAKLAKGRKVRGIILAPELDRKLHYAVRAIPGTQLLRYETKFEIYPEPAA